MRVSYYTQRQALRLKSALERLGDDEYNSTAAIAAEAGVPVGSVPALLRLLRRAYPDMVIASRRGPGGGTMMTENEGLVRDYEVTNLLDLQSRAETIEANLRKTVERARAPEEAARLRDTLLRMVQAINDLVPDQDGAFSFS